MRKALADNLETSKTRLTNFQKAKDNLQLVQLEIDRLENKIRAISEMAVNRHEPDFISGQVDEVASSMVQTEKTMSDLDFLTAAARASDDAAHLVITRRKTAFLMMNRYPYSVGHLMAVPYKKTADLSSLGENEIVDLWNMVIHAQRLLRAAARAQGFNVGLNLGECAGAGVVDHLHIHIVPRWSGDTNFMPVIAGTKTISEGLRALYDKLVDAQTKLEKEAAR